jgi:hypothetical protein
MLAFCPMVQPSRPENFQIVAADIDQAGGCLPEICSLIYHMSNLYSKVAKRL